MGIEDVNTEQVVTDSGVIEQVATAPDGVDQKAAADASATVEAPVVQAAEASPTAPGTEQVQEDEGPIPADEHQPDLPAPHRCVQRQGLRG